MDVAPQKAAPGKAWLAMSSITSELSFFPNQRASLGWLH